MKLFSRKALVAGATAVAVAFAGTSVATATEDAASSDSINQLSSGENGEESLSSDLPALASLSSTDKGDGELSSKPDEIASWISVFTAVIGALAAAFSFATKYLGFKI